MSESIFVKAICHGCAKAGESCTIPMRTADWRRPELIQHLNTCRDYQPDGDCFGCYFRDMNIEGLGIRCDLNASIKTAVVAGTCKSYVCRDTALKSEWMRLRLPDTGKPVPRHLEYQPLNVSPYKKKKESCYLTTAYVEHFRLKDDCETLTNMRSLRDNYVVRRPDGQLLVQEYCEVSPKIIAAISCLSVPEQEAAYCFIKKSIEIASQSVASGDFPNGLELYRQMYSQLVRALLD